MSKFLFIISLILLCFIFTGCIGRDTIVIENNFTTIINNTINTTVINNGSNWARNDTATFNTIYPININDNIGLGTNNALRKIHINSSKANLLLMDTSETYGASVGFANKTNLLWDIQEDGLNYQINSLDFIKGSDGHSLMSLYQNNTVEVFGGFQWNNSGVTPLKGQMSNPVLNDWRFLSYDVDELRLDRYNGSEWIPQTEFGAPIGVFAILNATTSTTLASADTWYPVSGIFINEPMEGFYLNLSDPTNPAIVYDHDHDLYMQIFGFGTWSVNKAAATLHLSISVNGVVDERGASQSYQQNINQPYSSSGHGVTKLTRGDRVQIVIKSDKANAVATAYHLTASINKFFQ